MAEFFILFFFVHDIEIYISITKIIKIIILLLDNRTCLNSGKKLLQQCPTLFADFEQVFCPLSVVQQGSFIIAVSFSKSKNRRLKGKSEIV